MNDYRCINITVYKENPLTGIKRIIKEIRPSWVEHNIKIEVFSKTMYGKTVS